MADSEDLKRLASGELDLSRCDFRKSQLSGMDLRGRNFSHSLFEKAQCEGTRFDGSDFRAAQVSFMNAKNAVFDECKLDKLHFGYTDLSGASLRNASATGAIFQNVELKGADLRGAKFSGGTMNADTALEGVISSESTDFEGLKILRSTSRDPLFGGYIFKDGTLNRQSNIVNWEDVDLPSSERSYGSSSSRENPVTVAGVKIQRLLQNPTITRLTAQQFAGQIEDALRDVPATHENNLAEPLQTMLEFAEVLRKLAPDTQLHTDPLDRANLERRIVELEALVGRLTQQLANETQARAAAEALAASDGFRANFNRMAGKSAGVAVIAFATSFVLAGATYFLGSENPVVATLLPTLESLSK